MLPLPPADFGPLPVRVSDGLSGVVFVQEPESAHLLAPGQRRESLRVDVGNTLHEYRFQGGRRILQDNEVQSLRVGGAWGVRGGEVGATAVLTARNGGFFDPLIRWWHANVVPFRDPVLGVPPDHQARLEVDTESGALRANGAACALTSVQLTAKRALSPGWAVRGAMKLPIAGKGAYLDSGATDLAVSVLGSFPVRGKLSGHVNAGVVRAGTGNVGALTGGSRWLTNSVVAAEYRAAVRTAVVVQMEDTGFPFLRDLPGQGGRRQQMSFGAWHRAGGLDWNAGFSENIYPMRVTPFVPDIMFSIGVRRTL